MSRKDILLEQFLCIQKKSHWFVSFQSAVAELTPEQAVWKKSDTENSIKEIVSHLVFWNERFLNLFKGIPVEKMAGNNDSTFTFLEELDWNGVIERFTNVIIGWSDTIGQCQDEKLDQLVKEGAKETWSESLSSITLHNAYHIGQIVTIRKMQESWNNEQGVS
jgi:uncharacterized damage-inducible protein DinB